METQSTPWERFAKTLDRAEELGPSLHERILVLTQAARIASGMRSERLALEGFLCIGETAARLLNLRCTAPLVEEQKNHQAPPRMGQEEP